MLELHVETNVAQLLGFLDEIVQEELPFALSVAINRTAVKARDEVRREVPRRFTIRRQGVLRGFQVHPSSKRQWPRIRAEIGTRDAFWRLHETGGIKRASGGRNLAIPTLLLRRTKRGLISRAQRPRQLIAAGKAHKADDTIRATKKRGPPARVSILYLLRPQARIRDDLGMRDTVAEVVDRELVGEFQRGMREGIESGKRRALSRKGRR